MKNVTNKTLLNKKQEKQMNKNKLLKKNVQS